MSYPFGATRAALIVTALLLISMLATGRSAFPTTAAQTPGVQWQQQMVADAGFGAAGLRRIACPGARRCVAVGEKGVVLVTTTVATAMVATAVVAGTAVTGGLSGATPTAGPSATTAPASGRVTLGFSSRGETVTLVVSVVLQGS